MEITWVDAVIVAVFGYYLFEGWQAGFVSVISNSLAFLASLWLAIRFRMQVGEFFTRTFGITEQWRQVVGYALVAVVSFLVLSAVLSFITRGLVKRIGNSKANRLFGAAFSSLNGLTIVTFLMLFMMALPLKGTIRKDIRTSYLGKRLVTLADRYGGSVTSSLEETAKEAIRFITVNPKSDERLSLDIAPEASDLSVDAESEDAMLALINGARVKANAGILIVDPTMRELARGYSRKMFLERFFSHLDKEGHNAGDRMRAMGIEYAVLGENLAYAPDVETAHEGLMNSPSHWENIMSPGYHRVGIGVISTEDYGKMFVQVFAD